MKIQSLTIEAKNDKLRKIREQYLENKKLLAELQFWKKETSAGLWRAATA